MARLTKNEFMDKVKALIGDRDDDEALSFLEDCNDTITDSKDEYKEKYETAVKEKEELDKQWRTKYKERFYQSDDQANKDKDKEKDKDLFTDKTDKQLEAENTTIDSLFKVESEE
jgi:hypothetical protein